MWPYPSSRTDANGTTIYIQNAVKLLGANDILVLPEAGQSYLVDTSHGFQRNGAAGPWRDATTENFYDEMVRVKRGIVGMGPSTKIELGPSSFSRPEQLRATGGVSTKAIGLLILKLIFR